MIVFLDTNILLDILLRREPFFTNSYACFRNLLTQRNDVFITASSITDVAYLLKKALQDGVKAKEALQSLLLLVNIADTRASDIQRALQSPINDFEDAVFSETAARLQANLIITRNVKDFAESSVPAKTPLDFLQT